MSANDRGAIVPLPPRVPLPDAEPIPASPDFADQRAGELGVGSYASLVWRDKPTRRRRPKFPTGFRA